MGQVVLAGDAPSSRPRVKFQNDVRRPPTPAPHPGAFAPSAVGEDAPAHARRLRSLPSRRCRRRQRCRLRARPYSAPPAPSSPGWLA